MASQHATDGTGTFPITGGALGAVGKNLIIVADGANPGNGKVSTASALGIVGVTLEKTDTNGYAAVQTSGVADILVGAGGVAAGNLVTSDADGKAVAIVPANAGASVKQVAGVALTTVAANGVAQVLLQPQLALTA
ncbi:MAG: hypothetical protein H8F28_19830 [Fibrella sp.]|nr:hypothetical protein [Armatimonadota bacterium]